MFCGVCTGISGVKGLGKLILVEEGNPVNALVCVCGCVGVWVCGCVWREGEGGRSRERKKECNRRRVEGREEGRK